MAYIYGNWSNQICATVVGASNSSRSSSSSRRSSSSSSRRSSSSSSFQFCYDPPKCPTGYNYDITGYDLQGCPTYSLCYCIECNGSVGQTKTLSNTIFAGTYTLSNNNPPTYVKTTGQVGSSSSTSIVSLNFIAYNTFTQRWEIYKTINGVKQIINYYAPGSSTNCPCTGWINAANSEPILLRFCDQKVSSSNSCGSSCTNLEACPPGFLRTQTGFDLCGCAVYGPCTRVESSTSSSSKSSCSPTVLNCSSGTFKYCRPDVPNSCGDENCLCISGSSTSNSSMSNQPPGCTEPQPCDPGPNCTTKMRKIDGYDAQGCPIYSAECYKCEEVMPDPNDCPCGCCGDSSSTSAQGTGLSFRIITAIASSCAAVTKPTCPKDCYPYLVTLANGCQIWKCSCKCIPPPLTTTTTPNPDPCSIYPTVCPPGQTLTDGGVDDNGCAIKTCEPNRSYNPVGASEKILHIVKIKGNK